MTTLAYSAKHNTLASDSRAIHGNFILGEKPKIGRRGQVLFGATGTNSAQCRKFLDWCAGGMVGEHPHTGDHGSGYMGFIFPGGDEVVQICMNGINVYRTPIFAAGSGKKIATGALEVGAHPRRAIKAAIKWDVYSNGSIQEVRR